MRLAMQVALAAAFSGLSVLADEDIAVAGGDVPVPAKASHDSGQKHFSLLPRCWSVSGEAEVLKPGLGTWTAIEEGRYYPLGSSYRTRGNGRLEILFGAHNKVVIAGDSFFSTKTKPIGDQTRTIVLGYGNIEVSLAKNLPEGAFEVSVPGFVVKNPAGESKYSLTNKGDGYEIVVRCVTGSFEVAGRHFNIPSMQAADEFRLRSSHDELATIIYGTSGDYTVKIDRGIATSTEITDEGQNREVSKLSFLEWRLSVNTKIFINRAVPSIGERMSVSVMTFDAAGNMKNHYAFSEGRAEVNTGELVRASKEESEEFAKRAADVAEDTVTEAVVAPESNSGEESSPATDAADQSNAINEE